MSTRISFVAITLALLLPLAGIAAPKHKALIVDGQNNHKDWPQATPQLKFYLESTGLFTVDVATTPPEGGDLSGYKPDFSKYDVVVSNYNGDAWPAETRAAFEKFVVGGGGFVSVHAADNAFPEWEAYNKMIALGGWGNRSEASGPYARFKDGKVVLDHSPGRGGSHGKRHEFTVDIRYTEHPVTKGLPESWMHAEDELYDSLRGPAENMNVLATAYSGPATGGTGHHEPMLIAVSYGKGRVFHTTLGHADVSRKCVGFIVTFQRGVEWAASGSVTQKVPADFPGAERTSVRE